MAGDLPSQAYSGWGSSSAAMIVYYCYCDVEDGSDRVCTPGSKKECEAPWVHCQHFQMRRNNEQGHQRPDTGDAG